MTRPNPSRRTFLRQMGVGGALITLGAGCSARYPSQASYYTREEITYGRDPLQVVSLTTPSSTRTRPVAILIHGGYWRVGFTREEMADLAKDLARVGWAAWNIDYRRVGESGGGYSGTLEDVAAATDKLADVAEAKNIDLNRVVVLGHSAGAQLAMWTAGRHKLPAGAPGAGPKVRPHAVVSLSGVLDLAAAANAQGDERVNDLRASVTDFVGGDPAGQPQRYQQLSPITMLPLGVPQLVMHGTTDDRVPFSQSSSFAKAATNAGDKAKLVELHNVNHFDVVKSTKAYWDEALAWLTATIGDPLR